MSAASLFPAGAPDDLTLDFEVRPSVMVNQQATPRLWEADVKATWEHGTGLRADAAVGLALFDRVLDAWDDAFIGIPGFSTEFDLATTSAPTCVASTSRQEGEMKRQPTREALLRGMAEERLRSCVGGTQARQHHSASS
jgi:hypothetical protein